MVISMAIESMSTALKKVRGLGSAHNGTGHFWHQRLTALALIPLVLWFCFSVASLPSSDYVDITRWFSSVINSILAMLFIVIAIYHGQLGLQMVIQDYIHTTWVQIALIIFVQLLSVLASCLTIFIILKLYLSH